MRILLSLICSLLAGQAQALGNANVSEAELLREDVTYYTNLAAGCGENSDNLLCYFSPQEIQQALGLSATEALTRGLLDPSAAENFAAEDGGDFEYEISARRAVGRSKRPVYKKRYTRSSRGRGGAGRALVGYRSGAGAPVWGRFIATLKSCKPGCVPVDYNAYRGGGFSCHNSGRAIDVGGIACGGSTHYALGQGQYASFVSCARRSMKVLYRDGRGDLTTGHYNHGHFSIGCPRPGGGRYW
jgi:hypothetical protein